MLKVSFRGCWYVDFVTIGQSQASYFPVSSSQQKSEFILFPKLFNNSFKLNLVREENVMFASIFHSSIFFCCSMVPTICTSPEIVLATGIWGCYCKAYCMWPLPQLFC